MKRLTKSQYQLLSWGIKVTRTYPWADNRTIDAVAKEVAHQFAQYDTEFDRTKFLKLCGITD